MTHLIDKDVLVAEIERLKNTSLEYGYNTMQKILADSGKDISLRQLQNFIDTIEVKEVPEWKPAAIAYKKDRLPRYDSALKRIVDRDEDGCYFLTMDDLYKLPKAQKGKKV